MDNMQTEGTQNSKKKIIYGAAALVVLALIVFFALGSLKKGNSKEAVVTNALLNLTKSTNVEKDSFAELAKTMGGKGGSAEVSMKLEEMPSMSSEDPDFRGWGVHYSVANNVKEEKSNLNFAFTNQDNDFLKADLYCDLKAKKAKVSIPVLSKRSFMIDFQDGWENKLEDSYIASILGLDAEMVKPFKEYMTQTMDVSQGIQSGELFNIDKLKESFEKKIQIRKILEEEIKVTELENKTFTVNEKEVSCKGYQAIITKDTVLKLWTEIRNFIVEDEHLSKSLESYFNLLKKASELEGDEETEQIFANIQKDMNTNLDKVTEFIQTKLQDIQMELYVNKDNEIISLNTKLSADPEKKDQLVVDLLRKGGTTLSENMVISCTVKDDDIENKIMIEKESKTENDVIDQTWTLKAAEDEDEQILFVVKNQYNKKNNQFNLDLQVDNLEDSIEGQTVSLIANGTLKNDEVDFLCDISKLVIRVDNEDVCTLSGSYKLHAEELEIAEPSGEEFDVWGATDKQWQAVIQEVQSGAMSLYFGFAQQFQ